ncbi:MAG: hypothetical protein ACMXX7_00580 [Candidatus Woesearchaeota archaeon]
MKKLFYNKKAQAALEFMTTYGWALVALVATVGVLGFMGFFDGMSLVSDRCVSDLPFVCKQGSSILTNKGAAISLSNPSREEYRVSGLEYRLDKDSPWSTCMGFVPRIINPSEEETIVCNFNTADRNELSSSLRSRKTMDIRTHYSRVADRSGDFVRNADIELLSRVSLASQQQSFMFASFECEFEGESVDGIEPCIEFDPALTNTFSVSSWESTNNPGRRKITFGSVDLPDVIYECRTGHISNVNQYPFEPCDGVSGQNPYHYIKQDGNHIRGNYRTQLRIRQGNDVSSIKNYDYYMWSYEGYSDNLFNRGLSQSLSYTCNKISDPNIYFNKALEVLNKQGTFSSSSNLDGPEMRIQWSSGSSEFISFKKELEFNEDNTLILLKRRYGSVHSNSCSLSWPNTNSIFRLQTTYDCDAVVVNRDGQGVCLANHNGDVVQKGSMINDIRPSFDPRDSFSGFRIQYFSEKFKENNIPSRIGQDIITDVYGDPIHRPQDGSRTYYILVD